MTTADYGQKAVWAPTRPHIGVLQVVVAWIPVEASSQFLRCSDDNCRIADPSTALLNGEVDAGNTLYGVDNLSDRITL